MRGVRGKGKEMGKERIETLLAGALRCVAAAYGGHLESDPGENHAEERAGEQVLVACAKLKEAWYLIDRKTKGRR